MAQRIYLVCLALAVLMGAALPVHADDEELPVVRAILFQRPGCPYCHMVATEVLPPLQDQYGAQLQVFFADTSTSEGHALYEAAAERFQFRLVVPILIIGDVVLTGGQEIPQSLPGLIEDGLAAGGVDWPAIPGFVPPTGPISDDEGSILSRIGADMPGNGIAIGVLCGMLLSVGYVLRDGARIWRTRQNVQKRKHRKVRSTSLPAWWDWAVLGLCVLGLIVAGYLAYVETTLTEAVCGPVGDCNAVQQSEYVLLFGLIPIALFGLAGYVVILALWAFGKFGRGRLAELAPVGLLGLALFGTAFSIYLTFLEPFVIGATCSWCLTSAVGMTLVLLLVARPGWETLRREWSI